MVFPLQYAYLTGVGIFALVWVVIFAFKKNVRKEMLILSVLASVLGFTQYFFTHDYWQPESLFGGGRLDVESFLLSFFYGGVAAPLYEVLFWKKPNYSVKPGSPAYVLAAAAAGFAALAAGVFWLGWNSIYVSSLFLLVLGASMILYRPSLTKHALYTGVLFMLLMFAVLEVLAALYPGIISAWWKLENLSGVFLWHVPFEELLSAFSWGFVAGPASELAARMRLKLL